MNTENTENTENTDWHLQPAAMLPPWLIETLQLYNPLHRSSSADNSQTTWGKHAAQLLWQRGLRDRPSLLAFLDPNHYPPASPFEFPDMEQAVTRLQRASATAENVAIWGDFDADGITATSVLQEGLSHWIQPKNLQFYIPDRFTESHGLSGVGIDRLAQAGVTLIVTCDTGSTDREEIERAGALGIDLIVTDHHTLAAVRPAVVALINPRSLPPNHPLADLSGVAVAYKLIEAMQWRSPLTPDPLPSLLELVAIGLIADLVALKNDSRYLAQIGLKRLQELPQHPQRRPGVAELLRRCQRSGDRPTDISFGIGPRINAVSRIQGRAEFCVELLTQRDGDRAKQLADQVELLNTRRREIQRNLEGEVRSRLETMDLSTTAAIVLAEVGWPLGVLGLVAGQIARDYGRPTVLLSLDSPDLVSSMSDPSETREQEAEPSLARGSARSVNGIDFYPVLESQRHLLTRFGGHPFAAGLSLPVENLELLTEGLNQELRARLSPTDLTTPVTADLEITVAELGQPLFRELKLLEPCGMGNPVPRLLIRNCRFENTRHANIKDSRGGKVRYIKTQFEIADASSPSGFSGVWWGHYRDELPAGPCDAVGELDFNTYRKTYEFRLEAVRPAAIVAEASPAVSGLRSRLLDWRNANSPQKQVELGVERPAEPSPPDSPLVMTEMPKAWADFRPWLEKMQSEGRSLALAYDPTSLIPPAQTWRKLLGLAKYLSRTGEIAEVAQLQARLGIDGRLMELAWGAIADAGFEVNHLDSRQVKISRSAIARDRSQPSSGWDAAARFLAALREFNFRQQYFSKVSPQEIALVAAQLLEISP